jgi:hypothetical protein
MGEIVWTTDGQQLWVGDGLTQGGSPVVGANVAGFGLAYNATSRRLEVAGLSADNIANGVNNKFFATELAQDAAASLFVNGTHTNISFIYDDELGRINATVTLDGSGISDIIADTSPQLGGNLDLNTRLITGTGNIDIIGDIEIDGRFTNSSLLIEGSEIIGLVPASSYISNLDPDTNVVAFGSDSNPNLVYIQTDSEGIIVRGNTNSINGPTVELQATRSVEGTISTIVNNDILGAWTTRAYNGLEFTRVSVIQSKATSDVISGSINTDLEVFVLNSTGEFSPFTFKSTGLFATAGVSFTPLSTAQITGVNTFAPEGSIGYNSDEKTLQFKNGSGFVSVSTVASVPTYANSTGKAGQIAGDADYIYFCYAANNWTRVAKDATFGLAP